MADTNTTVRCMIFEGGSILGLLEGNSQCQDFANKVQAAAKAALDSGELSFDLTMDPLEVGMALTALTSGQSSLAQNLGEKVRDALAKKLDELGIDRSSDSSSGGGLQDAPSPAPADSSAGTDASGSQDTTAGQSDDGQANQSAGDSQAPEEQSSDGQASADGGSDYQPL